MAFLMGIDIGTSSLKALIADENGAEKALAARSYQFSSPYPGWAEQDPYDWWEACIAAVREALSKSGVKPEDISGIGFSGQMHGLVALDAQFRPVRPAILHCDARSGRQVEAINKTLGREGVRKLLLNPAYTGFLLTSLLWVRENEPHVFERIKYVMLPKDYIRLMFTGVILSDHADASATLAYDIEHNCWSGKVLERFDVDKALFPECIDTCARAGGVTAAAASLTGLKEGTPVMAGGGDQVMQGLGNGATSLRTATINIGSSGQVCFQSEKPAVNERLSTNCFCGYKKGRWIVMGAIMHAGLALKWFRNICGGDYAGLDAQAEKVPAGSGGVIFLPYLNGERTPHINPDLTGAFIGCNIKTGRPEMTRAVMEGVTYALYQCMEVCGSMGLAAGELVASGGGARSPLWLGIQSDVFNLPLKIAQTSEQACLGAAIAAGVGAGVYSSTVQGCAAAVKYKPGLITPNSRRHDRYMDYYSLFKETYTASHSVLESASWLGKRDSLQI